MKLIWILLLSILLSSVSCSAEDVEWYYYDEIDQENIVMYSMGYDRILDKNFMGYHTAMGVAWIILDKYVDNSGLTTKTDIIYRAALPNEISRFTLKRR
jgi:hypothetical protein